MFHPVDVVCLCASCGSFQCCMTCSLLMLAKDAKGDHVAEAYARAGLMTALYVEMYDNMMTTEQIIQMF